MNNKEYVSRIANETGSTAGEVQKNLSELISILTEQLQDNNSVSISGFGTFEVKKKNERVSVNPVTRKRLLIPPKLAVNFKPSSSLKEKLKGGRP